MKIAFWSNVRGRSGVTTNMVCISALASIAGAGKSVLLENHYSCNSIASIVLPGEQVELLKESGRYYNREGIEYVLKGLYSGKDGEELLRHAAMPLLYTSMYYLPQSYIINKEVFNYEFSLVYKKLFDALGIFSDNVFIDTERNENLSSNAILTEADLVVVNLVQDKVALNEFFENYSSIKEKSVYLIGAYQPELLFNYRRICYEYHIPRDRIGIIPYNIELSEAMSEGRILQFLNRNYEKASGRENDYFMRHCKKSSMMVRKNLINLRKRKKEEATENYIKSFNSLVL
ncbi:MAG: hypothetical protein HFH68_15340 [Lachnospiraceae bacterium]|nr:hypothetical protein [Lachnospiraceae bacterium]